MAKSKVLVRGTNPTETVRGVAGRVHGRGAGVVESNRIPAGQGMPLGGRDDVPGGRENELLVRTSRGGGEPVQEVSGGGAEAVALGSLAAAWPGEDEGL